MPEVAEDLADQTLRLGSIPLISAKGRRPHSLGRYLFGDCPSFIRRENIADRDICSLIRQSESDRGAETPGTPRHQRHLAIKLSPIHV